MTLACCYPSNLHCVNVKKRKKEEKKRSHIRILSEKAVYFCFVRSTLVLSSVVLVHKVVLVELVNVRLPKVAGDIVLGHCGKVHLKLLGRTSRSWGTVRRQTIGFHD